MAKEALLHAKKINYPEGEAYAQRTLGVCHLVLEQYRYAVPELENAKQLFLRSQNFKAASSCYRHIGNVYTQTAIYDKAKETYERAIDFALKAGNERYLTYAKVNLGLVEFLLGNYANAIAVLQQTLDIIERYNDKLALAEVCFNIGNNYLQLNNTEKAQEYLSKSLFLSKELEYLKGVSQTYTILGSLYFKKGDKDNALKYMHEGLASALELNEKRIISDTYKSLAEVYKSIGDFEKALECFELYDETRKKLQFHENSSLVDSFKGELDVEKSAREVVEVKNVELEYAYELIKTKNKDITDSLKYARHIQQALLPPESFIAEHLHDYFVFYQPREIVSGDFYWFNQKNGLSYFATVDCTGHGVPGAFISIVSCNCLYQAFKEQDYTDAGKMLDRVHELFNMMITQTYEESAVKDGMDISLCIIDTNTHKINFAGANHNLYLAHEGELVEHKGDKNSIGVFVGDEIKNFTSFDIQAQSDDCIYMFSDGYADQFGGENGESKYFRKRLKKYLASISHLGMEEQRNLLKKDFNEWKGNFEQIDDVMVIGIKF
jgi:serine phosphatase RsbU (regulator of sigma subunit)